MIVDISQEWMKLINHTMGKTRPASVYWLLLADQELFDLWRNVCNSWIKGGLPDGQGVTGAARSGKGIVASCFKEFEGDITRDEKVAIFKACLQGKVLLKKDPNYKGELKSVSDMAKDIKVFNKLKCIIVQYYAEKPGETFERPITWTSILKVFPMLEEEDELKMMRRAAGEVWMEKLLNRNSRADTFPQSFSMRLENLFNEKFGGPARARTEPFRSFVSTDHMQNVTPAKLNEQAPTCTLAFVDFTREASGPRDLEKEKWTEAEILCLLKYIVHVPRNPTRVIVISCYVGELSANITTALRRLALEDSVSYHCEYSTFTRVDGPYEQSRFLFSTPELVFFIGVTTEEFCNWSSVFHVRDDGNGKCPLATGYKLDAVLDEDFNFPTAHVEEEEETLAEEELIIKERMARSAPTWDMVDMGEGFVNPFAKPGRMLMKIINLFSNRGDTVLDFFSGGQVLRCAILCGRECFVISETEQEDNFIQEYGRQLQNAFWDPDRSSWFDRHYDPRSWYNPEDRTRDQEPIRNPGEAIPDLGERLDSRAQGATVHVEDDEDVPPPPTDLDPEVEGGNETENLGEHLGNTQGQSTVPPNHDEDDNIPDPNMGHSTQASSTVAPNIVKESEVVKGGWEQDDYLEEDELPNWGEKDEEEAKLDPESSRAVGTNEVDGGAAPGDGEASRGESAQAGASNRTSSPNFASTDKKLVYVSPETGIPIVLPRPQTSAGSSKVGVTDWEYKDALFLHYKWTKGPDKDKIVDVVAGQARIMTEDYKKLEALGIHKLEPVFTEPKKLKQDPSLVNWEINSELGEIPIDEFGSMER